MPVDPQFANIQNLNISKHLMSSNFIIDNGYAGVISHANLNDIIGTLLIAGTTRNKRSQKAVIFK